MKRRSRISVHRSQRSGRLSQPRPQSRFWRVLSHEKHTLVPQISRNKERNHRYRVNVVYAILGEVRRLEARVGIEPTYKGFADLSLTTWVPRRPF